MTRQGARSAPARPCASRASAATGTSSPGYDDSLTEAAPGRQSISARAARHDGGRLVAAAPCGGGGRGGGGGARRPPAPAVGGGGGPPARAGGGRAAGG